MPLCFTFVYDINLLILSNNYIFQKLPNNQTLIALFTAIIVSGQDLVDIWVNRIGTSKTVHWVFLILRCLIM